MSRPKKNEPAPKEAAPANEAKEPKEAAPAVAPNIQAALGLAKFFASI